MFYWCQQITKDNSHQHHEKTSTCRGGLIGKEKKTQHGSAQLDLQLMVCMASDGLLGGHGVASRRDLAQHGREKHGRDDGSVCRSWPEPKAEKMRWTRCASERTGSPVFQSLEMHRFGVIFFFQNSSVLHRIKPNTLLERNGSIL